MASTLGTLLIELQANTAAFARGMNDAKTLAFTTSGEIVESLKRVGEQLGKLKFDSSGEFKKSAQIAGGLLAGIGVGIAGASVIVAKEVGEQVKQMEKLSQSYGLSVEEISQLRVASKLTGVDMETLTMGLGRMARAAAATAEGSKMQTAAFANLGVQVTDGAGRLRPMNDLLLDVAGRFSKLQDGTGKTALAMQLFGRSGATLIPFLDRGKEGVQQLLDLSDQLGMTWSENDAKNAEIFQQSIEILDLKTSALKENFVKGLLPAVDSIATAFVTVDKNGNSLATTFGQTVGSALKIVALTLNEMVAGAKELYAVFSTFGKWGYSGGTDDLAEQVNKIEAARIQAMNAIENPAAAATIGAGAGNGNGNPTFPSLAPAKSMSEMFELLNKANSIFDKDNSLQKQIDAVRALQLSIDQFRNAHPETIFLNLNDAAGKLSDRLKTLLSDQAEWTKMVGVVPGATQSALSNQALGALSLPQVSPTLGGNVQQQQQLYDLGNDMNEQNRERLQIFEQTRTPAEQYAETIQRLNLLYQDGCVDSDTYNRAIEDARQRIVDIYDPTEKLRKEQAQLTQEYNAGLISLSTYTEQLKKLQAQESIANLSANPKKGLAGIGQGIGAAGAVIGTQWGGLSSETAQATIQAVGSMQNAFTGFFTSVVMGTKSIGQAFSQLGMNLVGSIVEACAQMLAKWVITHVAMSLISKLFGKTSAVSEAVAGASTNSALAESAAFLGAANAYAFWAWNPPAAAAAAAAALAVGSGFAASSLAAGLSGAAVPSAAGGMELDKDQMLYGHKDEVMLPAYLTRGFKSIISAFQMPQAGRGHLATAGAGGSSLSGPFTAPMNFHVYGSRDTGVAANKIGGVVRGELRRAARRFGVS